MTQPRPRDDDGAESPAARRFEVLHRIAAPQRPLAGAWATRGLFAIALLWLLREAAPLLLPLLTAAMLTLLLVAPLERLRRTGLPEAIGAALLVAALAGGAIGFAALLAGPAAAGWAALPAVAARFGAALGRLHLPLPVASLAARTAAEQAAFETGLLRWAIGAASTLFLLYFMLACQRTLIRRGTDALASRRRRAVVLVTLRDAQRDTAAFIGTLGLIYAGVGLLTGIGLCALGLPGALLWGALATLLSFLPYVGPLALTVALLVAGSANFASLPMALAPAAWFLTLHAIDSNLVSPLLVGRRLAVSPVAVLIAAMAFGWLWGVMGAVLAVPLLVALRGALRHQRGLRWLHACISTAARAA